MLKVGRLWVLLEYPAAAVALVAGVVFGALAASSPYI
jgi:hypothetical protein